MEPTHIEAEHKREIRHKKLEEIGSMGSAARRIVLATAGAGLDGIAYTQGHFTDLKATGTTVGLIGGAVSLAAFAYNAHNAAKDRRREQEHDALTEERTDDETIHYYEKTLKKKLRQNRVNLVVATLGGAVSVTGLGIDTVAYIAGQFDWLTATGTALITVSGLDAIWCAYKKARNIPEDRAKLDSARKHKQQLNCG